MSASAQVRPLEHRDRRAWGRLWDDYLSFYRQPLAPEIRGAVFARLCSGEGPVLGMVATVDDRPVGLAHLIFHPSTWSTEDHCYLEDLYVAREARGTGVAEALFAAVYDVARAHGSERVYWQTQAFNAPARSLYDTVGRLTSFVVYEQPLNDQAD